MRKFFQIIFFLFLIMQNSMKVYAEKIAIISDIHGNYQALIAVLQDLENQKIDKLICLGDIVSKGPDSDLTLELVRKKANIIVAGNCDIKAALNLDPEYTNFTYHQLSDEQKKFLINLPISYDLKISGRNVRFFHASPFDLDRKVCRGDNLSEYSDLNSRLDMFKNTTFLNKNIGDPIPDVVVYGHIHSQFMQKIAGRTLINVGSVGNSIDFETFFNCRKSDKEKIPYLPQHNREKIITQANYVIIEGIIGGDDIENFSVSFKEINYDINGAVKNASDKKGFENLDDYVHIITKGMYGA